MIAGLGAGAFLATNEDARARLTGLIGGGENDPAST